MNFVLTVTNGPGPKVDVGVSDNLSEPLWFPLGFTFQYPPATYQYIQAMVYQQPCGNSVGGQFRFTDFDGAKQLGWLMMFCSGC